MESFFGIPINTLMLVLLVIFGLGVTLLLISALRNRVMFKMAARNLPRRRANTALTLLGLMLAAMIFSASFSTGDTLTYSIRNSAVKDLGEVDILTFPCPPPVVQGRQQADHAITRARKVGIRGSDQTRITIRPTGYVVETYERG